MTGIAVTASAQAGTYDDCIALVEVNPARAEIEALRWAEAGGGAPAQHCRAQAFLAQGANRRAAGLLVETATEDRTLPDAVRAELLVEAGEVYLGLGDVDLGLTLAGRALVLARDSRDALSLSARLKAAKGDWRGAASDLDGALARGEPDAELLVLRASARLRLGENVTARGDLAWAGELAPDMPSLWLERGALAEATGDRNAARSAWLKAIDLERAQGGGDRDGPVAEAARLRLQTMEAAGG